MTTRTLWRLTLISGLAVLALAVFLGSVFPDAFPQESAKAGEGFGTPVIAFEMARSMDDLEAVFGPPGDAERQARLEAMDAGNFWDYPFMVAYGAFILTFFLAVAQDTGRRYWWLFAALGVLAALADAVENGILLQLTAHLAAGQPVEDLLRQLPYPVWIKFFSLMLAGWGLGTYLLTRQGWWMAFGFAVMLLSGVVSLGYASPAQYTGLMGPAIGGVWVVQLVVAGLALKAGDNKSNQELL